ncbi:2Fe-2S iron-sulfur cluster-binding protein [Pontiellaceae bacterium B12227]|nr:2Fe-2S iron-sulfur cluster-binding protein [Pontiellaceae bacterium B12227]
MSVELSVNGKSVSVESGATVLDAAEKIGIEIPTLCHLKGREPETSCMLCVVSHQGRLIPSCSAKAADGMEIDTECEAVQAARKDILNLLLSEHVGDCEAPCVRICPAGLDIPLMLREIERGNLEASARIAKRDLAIPATLGYVCPAPCEKGCRRGQMDAALEIRTSHRQVAEQFQTLETDFPDLGKSIAVVGAGAAGLSAAWKLRQLGYGSTVFDKAEQAGGDLRNHETLPLEVLDAEVESLRQAGIDFKLGKAPSIHDIADGFAGVVFASEEYSNTEFADAFYAEEHKLAVKAVTNGKAAAVALDQFLRGEVPIPGKPFDSKIGKLRDAELEELKKNCSESVPVEDLAAEAARCLHCDCRKPASCKLRKYAEQYGADQKEFPADERGHVQLIGHDEAVLFEPGKCIKCGLCVKITKEAGEELGLTFVGRGFNTRIAVPLGRKLEEGLRSAAKACVEHCPTGALAFSDSEERG